VFEALGLADSAAIAASRHDAARATAEEIPLLPTVLVRSGHAEQGLTAMREWIARHASQANAERMASATTHLAEISLEAGRYADAEADARRAVALSGSANVVEQRGRALLVVGAALARANRADSAARLLSRAEMQLRARVSTELGFEMNVALGDALAACGRDSAALVAYDRAASMGERMRASFDDDLDQARVHAEKLAPFDGALRVLLAAIERPNVELVARWSQRRKEALFAGGRTTQPLSVAQLQHRLGTHDALIDYVMLDTHVAAVVITPMRAQVIVLPATAAGLTERITALRRPYAAYNGRVDVARLSFDARNSAAMYASLVRPIEAALHGALRLIVVPDGALHLLPFDALVTTGGARPSFLVDRYEISYLPSAGFLSGAARQKLSAGSLLFVGYGVEGDTAEWKNVSAAWAGPSHPLLGADASEARVASSAPRFDILHFAVHARANVADPLASNLSLAASGGRDGIFQASEIEHVRMTPALVVLSACETDAGVVLRGTGAMGLARAFLVAGARGVVGTEWSVGPATTRAMTVFYQRLAAGSTPGAALRSAKLALRGDPATANPFYWAPFTLVVR
jgi:CHAT domain-containing protein